MADLTHDELANDLAIFFSQRGKMVWAEPSFWHSLSRQHGSGLSDESIPDVFAITNSPTPGRWDPLACDVKRTRPDFLQDAKKGKWKKYLPYSARVAYAVPEGLVKAHEIPEGAGLIIRVEKGFGRKKDQPGWKWIIEPPPTSYELTERDWMNLCRIGRMLYTSEIEEVKNNA